MRRILGVVVAALVLSAQAPAPESPTPGPPSPDQQPPGPQWLPRQGAELRALDKISAMPTTLRVQVGQSVQFESLSIKLLACVVRPPDQAPDAAAFLDVQDSHEGAPGFHGWMFAREPELGVLESPVYDLRLVGCTSG